MIRSKHYQTDPAVCDQILALLRSALWGEERFPYRAAQDVNWETIHRELKLHAVQYLLIDLLARANPAQSQLYIAAASKNMMRWYKIMQEQQKLCFLLRDAGIPCAVVKGAAAASCYPQPSSRPMGDIDLLVDPADFDRACLLVSDGADYLGENFRHKEYRRNGTVVEVHRAFSTFQDPQKRAFFDRRVFGAIKAAQAVSTDNYTFFRLPKTEHGLVLLEHIDIHLANGLGLRQIIDWMMFVDKELTDEVWHNEFAPFLQQLGRETLAVTVTRMCQLYLGLRADIAWCSSADEALCHELMKYVLHQGNFGRKNQSGSNCATNVISASRNPFTFFRILQHRGCQNWGALARYPLLKPFAWLYQLTRYARHTLHAKHPVQFLRNAIKRSKTQADLLEELGVSRIAEEGQ